MSQGMRNCSKTRVFDANNAGSVVINMNKFHSNTSVLIPLYNSNYSNPFNLSLVMSINDFNTVSPNSFEFGKGVRLNLYKNFTVDEPFLRTDNSDFSSNLFVRVDPNRLEFKSSETSDYIIAEYVDTELEYYDQYGNYFVYNRNPLNDPITLVHCKYPTSYYDKGGKRKLLDIVINDDHDISMITSASGEKAVFSKNTNGLVNKIEIKRAVEELYGVKVESVNTMNYSGKNKSRYTKSGFIQGRTAAFKKAIVMLAEGDTIDFFSNI